MPIPSRFPRIEGGNAGWGEVGGVTGDDGHVVNESSGRNIGITLRSGIGYVQGCTSPCNLKIDCEHPSGKPVDNLPLNPNPENLSLDRIAPIDLQHAKF